MRRSSGYPPTSLPRAPMHAGGAGHVPCSTSPVRGTTAGCSPNTHQTALREAERRGLPTTNCSRWPSDPGPNPGCVPAPGGPGNAGWWAAPAGLDPATPLGRRPGPAGAPAVTGPLAQRRQRPGHGWRSGWTRADGLAAWPVGPGQRAQPTTSVARPGGLGYQPGLGPVVLGHREQLAAGKAASFAFAQQRRSYRTTLRGNQGRLRLPPKAARAEGRPKVRTRGLPTPERCASRRSRRSRGSVRAAISWTEHGRAAGHAPPYGSLGTMIHIAR